MGDKNFAKWNARKHFWSGQMLGEGSKQKDGRRLVVTSGSLERKKEWLEHLKKRIFKMTLRKAVIDKRSKWVWSWDDNEQTERHAFSCKTYIHRWWWECNVDEGDVHDADDDGNGDDDGGGHDGDGGGGGDGGGDEESHDDDNEQRERRFSVSAFTSCHAETQREREGVGSGLQDKSTATIHRHRSTNCALCCTYCTLCTTTGWCALYMLCSSPRRLYKHPLYSFAAQQWVECA